MRLRWACRISALLLGLTLLAPHPASTSEKIAVDGSTGVMPLVAALAKVYQERHPATVVEIGKGLGTKARLQALEEGKIDIALASHGLVAEELSQRGMTVHEIAKVAVVFGVNASVSAANLTDAQVCEIYAGRVTSWKALGGPDIAIAPRTRPDSEVDTEVVRDKIPCLKDLKMPDGVKVMPEIWGHGEGTRRYRGRCWNDDRHRRGAEPGADQGRVAQWNHPQRGQRRAQDLRPHPRLVFGYEGDATSGCREIHGVRSQFRRRGSHRGQRCGAGEMSWPACLPNNTFDRPLARLRSPRPVNGLARQARDRVVNEPQPSPTGSRSLGLLHRASPLLRADWCKSMIDRRAFLGALAFGLSSVPGRADAQEPARASA